jgi:hypothetical protein
MPGANAPAASRAVKKAHELVTTGSPDNTGIPCANGFTVYSALSLVIGLCCHHRQRNASALSPT